MAENYKNTYQYINNHYNYLSTTANNANTAGTPDVLFSQDGLEQFIKLIRTNDRDNLHFVSTSDMAEKRATTANYVFSGYEKEIEDAFPATNNFIGWNKGNMAKICIINNEFSQKTPLNSDANRNSRRYTWVRGGSLLAFETDYTNYTEDNRPIGTIWVNENNGVKTHTVLVKGFNTSGNFSNIDVSNSYLLTNNIGTSTTHIPTGYIDNLTVSSIQITSTSGLSSSGALTITNTTDAARYNTSYTDPAAGQGNSDATVIGSITTLGGIAARKSIKGYKVHGAVFNDYAEYRHTEQIEPGRCVIETGNGDLVLSSERMQKGANIVSDTYGFSIGETQYANTPIAVCGRVLAYPYEPRETFQAGDAVCSAPNGTVSRMHRGEISNWPDTIIGYVSEIPQYETWGSDNIEIKGRIWIKVI